MVQDLLYKGRSESGKKEKMEKDKSKLEMGEDILSFLLGQASKKNFQHLKQLEEIRFWPGSKWKRNKGGKRKQKEEHR